MWTRFMDWLRQHVAYLSVTNPRHKKIPAWFLYIHIFPVYCVCVHPWGIDWYVGLGWTSNWVRRRRAQRVSQKLRDEQAHAAWYLDL